MTDSADSSQFSPVVVMPTYNNSGTLADILRRIHGLGLPLIVVNDGATDKTSDILADWTQRNGASTRVLDHPCNRGKGAALQTGFGAAGETGFTHAVTMDSDGQLDPEEIRSLLAIARKRPGAFVVGVRTADVDCPRRNRVGRIVSNFFIRLESGLRITDSQCGFRVYPLAMVQDVPCRTPRFGYETEILTRAAWADYDIVETPVSCRYFPPACRVSHFKPWSDTARHVALHLRLLALAFAPWGPRVVALHRAWRARRKPHPFRPMAG
ncbi:MAG: glycosyltransferase family 2 protein [Candidatus Sumerlaeota bacterium]|nr:glycosyltransferase family 2 protein [Candidatus Sumerlaeota bacterium]